MTALDFSVGTKESVAASFHHHGSLKALWEGEWKMQCQRGVYPFNDGSKYDDFLPIIESLIKKNINEPFDERWPQEFLPVIISMKSEADGLAKSQSDQASGLYLRAAALCHIARFPVLCSPLRRNIWDIQKECYIAGTSYWKDPCQSVVIPHKYAAGKDGAAVPVYCRIPQEQAKEGPVPVMLLICGLDGFRADMPARCTNFFNTNGWAIVSAEIPGTGDCPAEKMDPESPDRLWSTVLDWIADHQLLDEQKVCVWGFSTGGYYALRVAHTHADRLQGVVAQGAYSHLAFTPEWIDRMDVGEYPSVLTRSLLDKYGYDSVTTMKEDAQRRFSLITNKIVDRPCAKTLLLNGMDDSIYPIEDSYLMMQHGGLNKEARFFPGMKHMAEPLASPVAFEWLSARLAPTPRITTVDALTAENNGLKHQLKTLSVMHSSLAAPSSPPASVSSTSSGGSDYVELLEQEQEQEKQVYTNEDKKVMYWDRSTQAIVLSPGFEREEICCFGSMG